VRWWSTCPWLSTSTSSSRFTIIIRDDVDPPPVMWRVARWLPKLQIVKLKSFPTVSAFSPSLIVFYCFTLSTALIILLSLFGIKHVDVRRRNFSS
jgi:hypothetical protein